MKPQTITATLEQDPDGTWFYVHVPKEVRDSYKPLERRGIIAVTATVGESTWSGSLLPWADGSAQLSIGKVVRSRERLQAGDQVEVTLEPRAKDEEAASQ